MIIINYPNVHYECICRGKRKKEDVQRSLAPPEEMKRRKGGVCPKVILIQAVLEVAFSGVDLLFIRRLSGVCRRIGCAFR